MRRIDAPHFIAMPRVKLFDEQEVLEKAMNLFWKKGYFDTSIQDLVNHLGINRASIYDTYGGKKQLFQKAFSRYRESNLGFIKIHFQKEKDVRQGFRELFEMALSQSSRDTDQKGCFVVNSTVEFIPNEKDFEPLIEANKQEFEGLFYSYLLQGAASGQISKDKNFKALAALFFTFYNGLRVVTKVDFNHATYTQSIAALLAVLD